ncbi:hypothetical protein QFZ67_003677 [Streptomyces sp. V1I1]|nr:hypothetical protein [Streptomyces sp. V1I1]
MTTELTLLSRVSYRDHEITAPGLRGLLTLLAGELRTGCSTALLVDGLWPDEQPENPTKALQIPVSRARARLGADVIAAPPPATASRWARTRSTLPPSFSAPPRARSAPGRGTTWRRRQPGRGSR